MYREAGRIGPTLVDVIRTLAPGEFGPVEVILIDDGSEDATPEACRAAVEEYGDGRVPVRLIRYGINRGKGAAVRDGLAAASGEFRLVMDADNSARVDQLPRLIEAMERTHAHLACGSRCTPEAVVTARPVHAACAAIFRAWLRVIGLALLRDTQCGFKLYSRAASDLVAARSVEEGYCFDLEHMLIVRRAGMGVEEVGIRWTHAPGGPFRPVRDTLGMLGQSRRIARRLRGAAPTLDPFTEGLPRPGFRSPNPLNAPPPPGVIPAPVRTYPKAGTRAAEVRERPAIRPVRVEELRPLPPPPAPVRPF
jgi:dolichyl-phosphate beta-glucosyltransferase